MSWRATIPNQYFCSLFNRPAFRNSFLGALPPTVGWSFGGLAPPLLSSMVLLLQPPEPTVWWAMTLVTSLPLSTLSGFERICSCMFLHGCMDLHSHFSLMFSPCSGGHPCPSHVGMENQPIRNWGSFAEVMSYLQTCCCIFLKSFA